MFIGWTNSTNGITLSERLGKGHDTPILLPTQKAVIVTPLAHPAPSWATLSFSFRRTIAAPAANHRAFTATSAFIWAVGAVKPAKPDDPGAIFAQHTDLGTFGKADFTAAAKGNGSEPVVVEGGESSPSAKPLVALPESLTYAKVLFYHGIVMFIAWGVAPFVGIFIARYLKDALGVWWYRLHLGIMFVFVGMGTVAGFALVLVFKRPPHFVDLHEILGVLIVAGTILQITLGFIANSLYSPDRVHVPWWDKAHWWLGRVITLLAFATIYLGLRKYTAYSDIHLMVWTIIYWAWIAAAFLVMLGGQIQFGQKHHVNGAGRAFEDSDYYEKGYR
ncbi:hypothetical protein HK104_005547 [Borealophlyctis nickersoniae]|nr:hypothetical protein HK104_005547 [Borealophlyctis nickersoniae]